MRQTDRFIYYYVRIRYKLSVPKAAAMLDVTAATWRSWERHASDMAESRWAQFNEVFDTHLSPDNAKTNGPASIRDLEHYLELLDAPDEPKPKRNGRVERTREACKALRECGPLTFTGSPTRLSAYDASTLVGVPLAQWQRWESGRVPALKKDLDRIKAAQQLESA